MSFQNPVLNVYSLKWDTITVTIVFLFDDARLNKIFTLLGLPAFSCLVNDAEQADFQVSQRAENHYILNTHHSNEQTVFESMNDLLVNTVNQIAFYFLRRSERLMLHCGALVVNNEAILFSGLSHAGKTSLAVNAWLSNYSVLGDDIVMCDPKNYTVNAFPKPLRQRLTSLDIPAKLMKKAGEGNIVAGKFAYDTGLFIGRKSPNIITYNQPVKIKEIYYLERGEKTSVTLLSRTQALVLSLMQVYPNQHCLEMTKIIHYLDSKSAIKRLVIGEHDQQKALEIVCG